MALDIRRLGIHLIVSKIMLELSRIGLRKLLSSLALQNIDSETRVLYGGQKCVQLEVTDELGSRGRNIGRVEIVPDIVHLSYGHPMVTFVSEEALLLREWSGSFSS